MVRGVSRRVIVVKPEQPAVEKKGGRSFSACRILGWRTAHRHHLGADGARFVNRL